MLYNRECRIVVDTIQINGLAARFSIKKTIMGAPNTCELQVRNLSATHRQALETMRAAMVSVEAGYKGATSHLFTGNLRVAISQREGADIVTSLASGDGEWAYRTARLNMSVRKGIKTADYLRACARALGVGEGNLDETCRKLTAVGIADMFAEGTVITGNAARELTNACKSVGLTWSIQDGKLQFLGIRQALDGQAVLISKKTGMIGEPTVDNLRLVSLRTLLIPDMFPGRKFVLEGERIRGQYRIDSCNYVGDTHGQDWYIDLVGRPY